MFTSIKGALQRRIKKLGIERQIKAALVCEAALKILEKDFPLIFKGVKGASFKDPDLVLKIDHPAFASEIKINSPKIIQKINFYLKQNLVKDIRTKIS